MAGPRYGRFDARGAADSAGRDCRGHSHGRRFDRSGNESNVRGAEARHQRLAKSDPAPYYISYTVYEQNSIVLAGAYGSLLTNTAAHRRQADVTMRIGSPALDNTHGQSRASGMISGSLPFGTDSDAIARVLWN